MISIPEDVVLEVEAVVASVDLVDLVAEVLVVVVLKATGKTQSVWLLIFNSLLLSDAQNICHRNWY